MKRIASWFITMYKKDRLDYFSGTVRFENRTVHNYNIQVSDVVVGLLKKFYTSRFITLSCKSGISARWIRQLRNDPESFIDTCKVTEELILTVEVVFDE